MTVTSCTGGPRAAGDTGRHPSTCEGEGFRGRGRRGNGGRVRSGERTIKLVRGLSMRSEGEPAKTERKLRGVRKPTENLPPPRRGLPYLSRPAGLTSLFGVLWRADRERRRRPSTKRPPPRPPHCAAWRRLPRGRGRAGPRPSSACLPPATAPLRGGGSAFKEAKGAAACRAGRSLRRTPPLEPAHCSLLRLRRTPPSATAALR